MLQIHRAERADLLLDALGGLLAEPLSDPFTPEVVAVPARGMERWLTQQLSGRLGARVGRRDGICANVAFPQPHELVADAVALASGIGPDSDPWRPERSVWALLDVVEHALDEPWAASLAAHLGHGEDDPQPHRQARRLTTVRHLAELLHRYAVHRPELVEAWAGGEDVTGGGTTASSAAWQAELWRRLRARIDAPDPAARVEAACARIEAVPELLPLPERISLFGLTRLPASHLRVLQAIGAHRNLHLFLLHPSPQLWQAVTQAGTFPRRRSEDLTVDLAVNPLLRSWGRDARELQLTVTASGPHQDHHHSAPEAEATTLLERIQADVRDDRRPPGAPLPGRPDERASLSADDRSIQVHACHGRARQVEVVRDAVLHALADDPTLEPRDVIVMCPDVETFAPLIHATFGSEPDPQQASDGPHALHLRVRLADRSLRQTNPVLGVVSVLLELAGSRVTASQVLDLADREPVRQRFRLDDDDIGRFQSWIADAGIRWGIDAAHRSPFKLETVRSGTWDAGLDRLLLGVTMTEDDERLYGGILPLDDVDSGAIDIAGCLAELITRLRRALDSLTSPQPITAWATALADAADALTRPAPREHWQRGQLQRILDALVQEAGGSDTSLALPEVRALLADRLMGRPTRANFRTGSLTICTLVPMRSVPHRVVCLLGLDDGAFPRKSPRDGDDVMLEAPQIGERDPRSEDRQLLLDAVMAAREQLIVTYTGNDERTNLAQPPAVPVGELLDLIDATATGVDAPAHEQVLIRHPLQPFDPRNFTPAALTGGGVWGFDPVTLEGARAITAPRRQQRAFLTRPLVPLPTATVELDDLVRFVSHPVRAFLRRRLGISVGDFSEEIEDGLSVELDALQQWGVGQRLLTARLAGVDQRAARRAEIARGTLPPDLLGMPVIRKLDPIVEAITAAGLSLREEGAAPEPIDVHITLPGGRTLTGTVPGVSGSTVIDCTYSTLAARHRIIAWVRLLALTAAEPERAFAAATVGRRREYAALARVGPLGDDADTRRTVATEQLLALLDLFDRGMREPLPIFCKSSAAYAAAIAVQADGRAAARKEWESDWKFDKEDRELEHQLVLAGEVSLDAVMETGPADDEYGPGWDPSETSRFGRLACRLWDGLLDREELS